VRAFIASWLPAFKHAWLQWLIGFDQFANNCFSLLFPRMWAGSWADETLSCRCYRMWRDAKPWGRLLMPCIDLLFKWQTIRPEAIGHCHNAYLNEMERVGMPPEFRHIR